MIKVKHEIAQRFSRLVRERRTIETHDRVRQTRTGRLEVALHAYLHLSVCSQARRVHDGPAYVFDVDTGTLRFLDMLAPRTVTPLAIDAFRDAAGKYRFRARLSVRGSNFWNAVMTEHATVAHGTGEAGVIRTI